MLIFLLDAFRFDPLSKGFFVLWNNNVKAQDTQLTKPSMGFFFSTIKSPNKFFSKFNGKTYKDKGDYEDDKTNIHE